MKKFIIYLGFTFNFTILMESNSVEKFTPNIMEKINGIFGQNEQLIDKISILCKSKDFMEICQKFQEPLNDCINLINRMPQNIQLNFLKNIIEKNKNSFETTPTDLTFLQLYEQNCQLFIKINNDLQQDIKEYREDSHEKQLLNEDFQLINGSCKYISEKKDDDFDIISKNQSSEWSVLDDEISAISVYSIYSNKTYTTINSMTPQKSFNEKNQEESKFQEKEMKKQDDCLEKKLIPVDPMFIITYNQNISKTKDKIYVTITYIENLLGQSYHLSSDIKIKKYHSAQDSNGKNHLKVSILYKDKNIIDILNDYCEIFYKNIKEIKDKIIKKHEWKFIISFIIEIIYSYKDNRLAFRGQKSLFSESDFQYINGRPKKYEKYDEITDFDTAPLTSINIRDLRLNDNSIKLKDHVDSIWIPNLFIQKFYIFVKKENDFYKNQLQNELMAKQTIPETNRIHFKEEFKKLKTKIGNFIIDNKIPRGIFQIIIEEEIVKIYYDKKIIMVLNMDNFCIYNDGIKFITKSNFFTEANIIEKNNLIVSIISNGDIIHDSDCIQDSCTMDTTEKILNFCQIWQNFHNGINEYIKSINENFYEILKDNFNKMLFFLGKHMENMFYENNQLLSCDSYYKFSYTEDNIHYINNVLNCYNNLLLIYTKKK